jgi:leader peptidase (prepilin peptidase) / N-methyltransferase
MTASVLAGGLLGAVCALPAALLAERAVHVRLDRTVRTRLVLAGGTTIFGAIAAAHQSLATTVLALLALVPAAAAAAVDVHERRLPDRLTATVAAVVATQLTVRLGLDGDAAVRGALALFLGGATCLLAKVMFTDAVGWGDVKLVPSLTALLAVRSWSTLYAGVLLWSALVAVTAVLVAVSAVLAVAHRRPSDVIAYGPALVVGTAGALAVAG